jgi:hypothetical protein
MFSVGLDEIENLIIYSQLFALAFALELLLLR